MIASTRSRFLFFRGLVAFALYIPAWVITKSTSLVFTSPDRSISLVFLRSLWCWNHKHIAIHKQIKCTKHENTMINTKKKRKKDNRKLPCSFSSSSSSSSNTTNRQKKSKIKNHERQAYKDGAGRKKRRGKTQTLRCCMLVLTCLHLRATLLVIKQPWRWRRHWAAAKALPSAQKPGSPVSDT